MKYLSFLFLSISLLLLIGCGGKDNASSSAASANTKTVEKSVEKTATPTNKKGLLVFRKYCLACHGADGKLAISGAKDLSISTLPLEERIEQVTNGKGLMTPYKDILSPSQIKSVCEYIEDLRK